MLLLFAIQLTYFTCKRLLIVLILKLIPSTTKPFFIRMPKMHLLAARWHQPHRLNFRQNKKRLRSLISSLILHLQYFIKNQIVHFFTCYNFVLHKIFDKTYIFGDICKKLMKNVKKIASFNCQ